MLSMLFKVLGVSMLDAGWSILIYIYTYSYHWPESLVCGCPWKGNIPRISPICISPSLQYVFLLVYHLFFSQFFIYIYLDLSYAFSWFVICISLSLSSVFLPVYHLYLCQFIICISLGLSYVFLSVYHMYFSWFITCISLSLSSRGAIQWVGVTGAIVAVGVIFQVVAEVHFYRQESNVPTTVGNRWRRKWENEPPSVQNLPSFLAAIP